MPDKTLLIVDDSKISRMMTKAIIIDKYPQINIFEAADGIEALNVASQQNIDFFSVDYNMPNMDGIEFITQIKSKSESAKFALLTANIQEATHKKAEEIGAKCFNKPITEECIYNMLEYFYD